MLFDLFNMLFDAFMLLSSQINPMRSLSLSEESCFELIGKYLVILPVLLVFLIVN